MLAGDESVRKGVVLRLEIRDSVDAFEQIER